MPHLLVIDGSAEAQKIELAPGQTITVGRTDEAKVVFNLDEWMSGLHFSVRNENGALFIENLSKSNGTIVNGRQMDSAVLKTGDRITAGKTNFLVADAPPARPARLRVGSWGFDTIPENWEALEGIGLRLAPGAQFQATMTAVEEPLPEGQTLADYIKAQMDLVRMQVQGAEVTDCIPAEVPGTEQAMTLGIFSPAPNGRRVCQRQIYVMNKGVAGVFTTTLLDSQAEQLHEAQSLVLKGLRFIPS